MTSQTDSQAGTFTATYNANGNLTSQTYPGALTASYGYDETGAATSLSYAGQAWSSPLQNSVTPDAHGNWASQNYLTTTQAYTYDKAGRLAQVQKTQGGQCTTTGYTYDADSNRTALTSYGPGSNGACQTSTATSTLNYSYSSADQLISGAGYSYAYDAQGDINSMPLGDGASADLSTYYANGMLASQQKCGYGGCGGTLTYTLDPGENRISTWNDSYSGTTFTNHYSGSTDRPAWTAPAPDDSTSAWTRYVDGLDGLLAATVDNVSGTLKTTLRLVDLHGDIMATATTSSSSTGPTATYNYDQFGSGGGARYGWLGGQQRESTFGGNRLLMGARAYNPGTGRFDQPDPVYGGSANAYDYALQNPLTNTDLNGTSFQGFAQVWLWYSYSYARWFFTWYINLWDHRRARLAEYFISYTGLSGGWHMKSGISYFWWSARSSWWGGAILPSWEQSWWLGAWVEFFWEGYRLVWGIFPIFDWGWSTPVWIRGWR